ncbi:MAG: hypothetical protein ACI9G1_001944, partial [Pirellulaceae bacterium]
MCSGFEKVTSPISFAAELNFFRHFVPFSKPFQIQQLATFASDCNSGDNPMTTLAGSINTQLLCRTGYFHSSFRKKRNRTPRANRRCRKVSYQRRLTNSVLPTAS